MAQEKPARHLVDQYFNELLRTLQHIVIHAMQLSGVNSEN